MQEKINHLQRRVVFLEGELTEMEQLLQGERDRQTLELL